MSTESVYSSFSDAESTHYLSVITPVFNTTDFLLETFRCIQQQTFRQLEWIIIDDGSTDVRTIKILDEIVAIDPRIIIVKHEVNLGLPSARNTGIKRATGKYLFFIDADDLIEHDSLEKFILTLEFNPSFDFVNSYVRGFGDQEYVWRGGFHEGSLFLEQNRNTSCFMAKREVFSHVLFDESLREGGEDWDFWLNAASKGFWGYTIPEVLFKYRRTSHLQKWQSISTKETLKILGASLRNKYAHTLHKTGFPLRIFKEYQFENPVFPRLRTISTFNKSNGLNLLIILPWMDVGGADKFNLNLIKGLKEKGWSITLLCTKRSDHPWLDNFREIIEDIFLLPNYISDYNASVLLVHLIKSRSIKITLISNSELGYYYSPFLRQHFPGMPIVDYVHSEDVNWNNKGYPTFSTVFSNQMAATCVTSQALKKMCVEDGGDASRIEVVYINVDTELLSPNPIKREQLRSSYAIKNNTTVILFVGRLTQQKQPEVLIKSIEKLHSYKKDFLCIIIGDGPDRKKLLKNIDHSPAKRNILFLGELSNEKVHDFMDAADIFFLPSAYEGIALSILEAMAKGLVIVGADVGGQKELILEDCGYLIDRSSPDQESENYASILNHLIMDPARIKSVGQRARSRVSNHFRLEDMIEQMNDLLSTSITRNNSTTSDLSKEYLVILNRLLHQEKLNRSLSVIVSNKVVHMAIALKEKLKAYKNRLAKFKSFVKK